MKTNIVLIGFLNNVTKKISEKLALDFGLYFADAEGMLEYNLTNEEEIEKLCGVEYLNGLKQKILKDISSYENTVISIPYSIFSANNNYEMFKKNCTIVFLNFSEEILKYKIQLTQDENLKKAEEAFLIAYNERTQFCKDNCNLSIDISKYEIENVYKKVKKYLDEYYL